MLVRAAAVLLLLCAAASPVAGTTAFELHVAELADATPVELVSGAHDARFRRAPDATLQPHESLTRWYRLTPAGAWADREPPLLAAYAPYGNRVTVLAPPGYAPVVRTIRDAGLDPRWSRHALVFDLPATLSPTTPVFVGIDPGKRFPAQLALETRAGFGVGELAYARRMTSILAAIAVMCLVIGAFALVLAERTLGYLFGAFVLSLLYLMLITGEAYSTSALAPLGAFGVTPVWIARAIGAACMIAFVRRFLAVDTYAPRLGRVFGAIAIAFVLLAAVSPMGFLSPRGWLPPIGNVLLFASSALALAAGVVAWRRGVRAARFFLPAWLPMLALDMLREAQLLGWAGVYPGNEYAQPGAVALAAVLFSAGMADRLLAVRRERDLARHEAERDPLTNTLNRRAITARIEEACATRDAPDGALALLFVDLDHFKRINDRYGHATGDACLKSVVAIVEEELRKSDALGRFGGEEFVVLLDGANLVQAVAVAERIRAHIEARCSTVAGHPVGLTASIGVADGVGSAGAVDLIAAADRAMYAAKSAGRNRVRDGREAALRLVGA